MLPSASGRRTRPIGTWMSENLGVIHDIVRRHRTTPNPLPSRPLTPARASRISVRHALSGPSDVVIQRRPAALIDNFNFIGHHVEGGISPGLRDRLRDVETALTAVYNRAQPVANAVATVLGGTPPSFEEWAGVTSARSWRPQSSCPPTCSLHQSGSAVDINYDLQPYIATRTTQGSTTVFGGELAGAGLQAQRRAATEVYDRAVRFMSTPAETAQAGARGTGETTSAVYARFSRVSDALRGYFDFAFLPDPRAVTRQPIADIEGATEADLLSTIPETERRPEDIGTALLEGHMQTPQFQNSHPGWPLTPREQYFRILRDYEHVRIPMVRGAPVARPADTRNPARGFLHMPPVLVETLVDVGRLRWGIADFGAHQSGDTHHFDLGSHDLTPDGQP